MSRDILIVTAGAGERLGIGISWEEARDAAKCPTVPRTAPPPPGTSDLA